MALETQNKPKIRAYQALTPVYCPICTHTVQVNVLFAGKTAKVTSGQKCSHCGASIDAGYVMRSDRAA